MAALSVVVVSDTHGPSRWRGVPAGVVNDLRAADVILHAGDVSVPDVLDELAAYAPVHVVMGNTDGSGVQGWGARPRLDLDLGGLRIGMIHDAGDTRGRGARMRALFPDADLVVYGHSHIPADVVDDGLRLFNPGSLTDPRWQPTPSYGVLTIDDGALTSARLVMLPRTPPRRR